MVMTVETSTNNQTQARVAALAMNSQLVSPDLKIEFSTSSDVP
jgi:hypothetical protein